MILIFWVDWCVRLRSPRVLLSKNFVYCYDCWDKLNLKVMKKLILSLLIVLFVAPAAYADVYSVIEDLHGSTKVFPDVFVSHPNHLAISWLYDLGAISGYPDGDFRPDYNVNRAEFMKMVVGDQDPDPNVYKNCFPDVKDQWFAPYVCYAYEQGIIDGYDDGSFKPENDVNRVEAMKIILNLVLPEERWPGPTQEEMDMIYPVDIDQDAWYAGYAKFTFAKDLADSHHFTRKDDEISYSHPGDPMTRKEVAEMMLRSVVYEAERIVHATIMAEAGCFAEANLDLMTEEEIDVGIIDIFNENGYSEEEMDIYFLLFEGDKVVQANIDVLMVEICGE